MSPIEKETVASKLKRLERNINFLEEYSRLPYEAFLQDHTIQGAAMHYMVESIEIIIDIGNHVLVDVGETTQTYKDVILKLGEQNIIPPEFAQQNLDMTGFRNLIIHAYSVIDMTKVYEQLQKTPKIFTQFSEYFQRVISGI